MIPRGSPPGTLLFPLLLAGCLLSTPGAVADEAAPTLAAALRSPGLVIVADCGAGRPHQRLADKVAGDLLALRGDAPERVACDDLAGVHWEDAHLVVLASDPADPVVAAVGAGLGLRVEDGSVELAAVPLRGADAGAVVTLPHPRDPDRWALLLIGTGPEALRRLDRHVRNDVAASALLLDEGGERLTDLSRSDDGAWRVPAGHPYRADEVVARVEAWRDRVDLRVSAWDADVTVDPEAQVLDVRCRVSLAGDDPARRGPGAPPPPDELWLLLSARAEGLRCEGRGAGPCARHDARDGTVRVRVPLRRAPRGPGGRTIELDYRLPLQERLDAWYLGPTGGYVLPAANWLPRVRGGPDEPFAARGTLAVALTAPGAPRVVLPPGEPGAAAVASVLVWGDHREEALADDGRAFVAPHAPEEVLARAEALREALERWGLARPAPAVVVAVDRPRPWLGEGLLLVPPDLLEPGPMDERTHLALERAATEQLVRLQPPGGRPLQVAGTVTGASAPVTARLWQRRGTWWEQIDEGPADAEGRFALSGRGRRPLMVSVEADGQLPAFAVAAPDGEVELALRPVGQAALLCLRCGPDLGAVRYPMVELEPGRFAVDIALGELHRRYGAFPYAFELEPGAADAVLVLDPLRPADQFPAFLPPELFHADEVHLELDTAGVRYWIEVPGGLLAPADWIGPAQIEGE